MDRYGVYACHARCVRADLGVDDMSKIRISVPDSAKQNDIIEIKAMIKHEMESGFRRNEKGDIIERDIIVLFECLYGDKLVFSADFNPAVAANPFLSFYTKAMRTDTFTFRWTDQHGVIWRETRDILVT